MARERTRTITHPTDALLLSSQINEYRAVFDKMDTDGSGEVRAAPGGRARVRAVSARAGSCERAMAASRAQIDADELMEIFKEPA